MKNFIDRIPVNPNRYKITNESGGISYATIEREDNASVVGTALNREAFMALQGMEASNTSFDADGNIIEQYSTGVLLTTFRSNGDVVEIFADGSGQTITKTTKFNSDGSISEVIS